MHQFPVMSASAGMASEKHVEHCHDGDACRRKRCALEPQAPAWAALRRSSHGVGPPSLRGSRRSSCGFPAARRRLMKATRSDFPRQAHGLPRCPRGRTRLRLLPPGRSRRSCGRRFASNAMSFRAGGNPCRPRPCRGPRMPPARARGPARHVFGEPLWLHERSDGSARSAHKKMRGSVGTTTAQLHDAEAARKWLRGKQMPLQTYHVDTCVTLPPLCHRRKARRENSTRPRATRV